ESEYERVGDDQTRSADVRVIAATNRDLEALVKEGGFREDLYYRLSVFPIEVPPLRERGDDVVQLASHFLERVCTEFGRPPLSLSKQQAQLLKEYTWPGNARELKNVIERAVILSSGKVLRLDLAMADMLQPGVARDARTEDSAPGIMTEKELLALQRDNVLAALRLSDWRVSGPNGAARLLGLKPTTLNDRIRKFGLKKPRPGGSAAAASG
ncbi:MAG TPA: sigma 54-interacting transcriptional regulator, partial [Gammaproteobacteria bacterium]|nr:sigma 54-interacting transcriptional regulator [Gammaproteobacteria bacterium]